MQPEWAQSHTTLLITPSLTIMLQTKARGELICINVCSKFTQILCFLKSIYLLDFVIVSKPQWFHPLRSFLPCETWQKDMFSFLLVGRKTCPSSVNILPSITSFQLGNKNTLWLGKGFNENQETSFEANNSGLASAFVLRNWDFSH